MGTNRKMDGLSNGKMRMKLGKNGPQPHKHGILSEKFQRFSRAAPHFALLLK